MSVKLATEVVIIYVLTTLVVTVVDAILVMSFTPERDAGVSDSSFFGGEILSISVSIII